MEVYINNRNLEELYESGYSKKLKLSKKIIDKFFSTIEIIKAAENIYDIWNNPSLKFEKYKNHFSMRLDRKYRLEMEVNWENDNKTVGLFIIIKLSNHYGD